MWMSVMIAWICTSVVANIAFDSIFEKIREWKCRVRCQTSWIKYNAIFSRVCYLFRCARPPRCKPKHPIINGVYAHVCATFRSVSSRAGRADTLITQSSFHTYAARVTCSRAHHNRILGFGPRLRNQTKKTTNTFKKCRFNSSGSQLNSAQSQRKNTTKTTNI